MATFKADPHGIGQLLRSREVQAVCLAAAAPEVARIAAATERDTGDTATSTHAEPADFGDRKGAVIVQLGAGVQLNFGNAHMRARHQVDRGR